MNIYGYDKKIIKSTPPEVAVLALLAIIGLFALASRISYGHIM